MWTLCSGLSLVASVDVVLTFVVCLSRLSFSFSSFGCADDVLLTSVISVSRLSLCLLSLSVCAFIKNLEYLSAIDLFSRRNASRRIS